MDIGEAVHAMKRGNRVAREGWNGKGMHLEMQEGTDNWHPFVLMKTVQGKFVPWLCSQTDLLASDWTVV